jgi:hypothetical protein
MANQKTIKMLPTVWANFFDCNSWPSKLFMEDTTEGAKTFLIPIGGGKSPPRIENEMSKR